MIQSRPSNSAVMSVLPLRPGAYGACCIACGDFRLLDDAAGDGASPPLPPMVDFASPWSNLGQQDQAAPAPQMPDSAQNQCKPDLTEKQPATQYLAQQNQPHSGLIDLFQKSAYTPPPSSTEPCHFAQLLRPERVAFASDSAGDYLSVVHGRHEGAAVRNFLQSKQRDGRHVGCDARRRAGIWRYGNEDPNWPEGWQVDFEGAVFPRLDPQGPSTPLIGSDFRFGIPVTYGGDRWEFKVAYFHISAHLGDEYVLYINPGVTRINYVRDGVVFGAGYFWTDSLRLYGEVAVAAASGGAEPGEIQFGFEWMQARNTGLRGGPFVAVNCRPATRSRLQRHVLGAIRLDVAKVRPRLESPHRRPVRDRQKRRVRVLQSERIAHGLGLVVRLLI